MGTKGSDRLTAPVAIAGGGPVGLMLALFLDRHGVPSVVFNTEDTVRWHPKGSTHNSRTMEHYRRLGIAPEVRKLGLPADHPTDVAYFTRFNGWELARLPMPSSQEKLRGVAESPRTGQVPEPLHRANQMYVEELLLKRVRSRPNITLRFGWEVGKFSEDAEGVTVEARRAADGAAEAWRAKYLAGCDGGRSFVRRSVGIKYEGYEQLREAFYSGRMISTHLTAPTLYRDFLGTRRGFQYWVLNRETRSTIVALDGKDQFLLFTKPSESNPNPDDAELARIVRCCAGADLPVKIIGHRPWTAGVALVAERFAAGRVLLAGDAVHIFTPNGGFGMNTGIDDAANLAWKLAAVAQGWGGARLLESYEAERKPVAHRNTKAARDFGKNIADVRVAPEIEDDTTTGERARKEAGEVLATFGEEFASIGVQLGARYDGSPVIVADGTPPPFRFSEYVPTSVPGGLAPHIWMREGRGEGDSLFDHLGIGFTLLRLGKSAPEAAEIQLAALERSVPLKVLHLSDAEVRELYGCDLALVRPDQHVAWRGNRVPADSGRMIRQVIGDPI